MKQETVRPRPEGGEFRRRECMVLDRSNSAKAKLDKLIQLAVERVGDISSSWPNGELDMVSPTRPTII